MTEPRPDRLDLAPGDYLLSVEEDGSYTAWPVSEADSSTSGGLRLPGLGYLFTLLRQRRPRPLRRLRSRVPLGHGSKG